MSSRPLLIAGIVGGAVAGVALLALTLALVAIEGAMLSASLMALLVLGAALGWVLDATWLCLALDRLAKLDHGRDNEEGEGGDGWGRPEPEPAGPRPPSEDPDWWSELDRELRAHREAPERAPVAG